MIFKSLPAFCRVKGVIAPSGDSHIEFEVWLSASGWNGKYMGAGNGGFAGSISYLPPPPYPPMRDNPFLTGSLLAGYAASSTDTGHTGAATDVQWALGHPEKVADFGFRAIHETAEKSKAIIHAFYGNAAKHSYFHGCSNGGREALMEAERFPADYDGIIAGAPALSLPRMDRSNQAVVQATENDPASYIPAAKLAAIESAALRACDAIDGLTDGLIEDPRKCPFDPTLFVTGSGPGTSLTHNSRLRFNVDSFRQQAST
jgi:feruloyl esterase